MIQFLLDTTLTGDRFPAGTLAKFDAPTERDLINSGAAIMCPLPVRVGQSYAGWTRSSTNNVGVLDTDYVILTQPVLPGGVMGLNSSLLIKLDWIHNATATRKFMAVDFGATNIAAVDINNLSSYKGGKMVHEVLNLNSLTSQKTLNSSTYGAATNDYIASAIDTTADVTITIKCKWGGAIASEAITLVGYSIWHQPGS